MRTSTIEALLLLCQQLAWIGQDHIRLPPSPCLTAVIGNPREPLLKEVGAVPTPRSDRLSRACCNGSVWDTPAPPSSAGLDRFRQGRRSRQPGWRDRKSTRLSHHDLVCRLLLEKKNNKQNNK